MPARTMARLRLVELANAAHCLPRAFGNTIPICGAVEEIDRVVLGTGRSNNEYRIHAEQSYGRSSKGIKVVLGALLTKRPCHSSSSTMMESV